MTPDDNTNGRNTRPAAQGRETRPAGADRQQRPIPDAPSTTPAVPGPVKAEVATEDPKPEPEDEGATEAERLPAAEGEDSTGTYADNPEIPQWPATVRKGKPQRPDRYSPLAWERLNENERWDLIDQLKLEGNYHGIAPQS